MARAFAAILSRNGCANSLSNPPELRFKLGHIPASQEPRLFNPVVLDRTSRKGTQLAVERGQVRCGQRGDLGVGAEAEGGEQGL